MAPTGPPAVCVSSLYLRLSPPEPQVRVHWPQELQAPHWHSEPKPVKSEQSEEIETSGGGFPELDGVNNPLSLLIYGEALAKNKESFGYESKAWNWVIFCRNTNVIWGEGIETAIFYNQHLGGETGVSDWELPESILREKHVNINQGTRTRYMMWWNIFLWNLSFTMNADFIQQETLPESHWA